MHIPDLFSSRLLLGVFDRELLTVFFSVFSEEFKISRSEIVCLDQCFVIIDPQFISHIDERPEIDTGLLYGLLGIQGIALQPLRFAGLHDILTRALGLHHHDGHQDIHILFDILLCSVYFHHVLIGENIFREIAGGPGLPDHLAAYSQQDRQKNSRKNEQYFVPPDLPSASFPLKGTAIDPSLAAAQFLALFLLKTVSCFCLLFKPRHKALRHSGALSGPALFFHLPFSGKPGLSVRRRFF